MKNNRVDLTDLLEVKRGIVRDNTCRQTLEQTDAAIIPKSLRKQDSSRKISESFTRVHWLANVTAPVETTGVTTSK
jgi:hypothetical protein